MRRSRIRCTAWFCPFVLTLKQLQCRRHSLGQLPVDLPQFGHNFDNPILLVRRPVVARGGNRGIVFLP
jgi:hypothetical protein